MNPIGALGSTDTRPWTDLDGNGLPFDANGNIQLNELTQLDVDADVRQERVDDRRPIPDVLNGWGKRGYNWEYTVRVQHQLADRASRSTAATTAARSATRPSPTTCATTRTATTVRSASRRRPMRTCPGGGGYQVCGLYDLKPAVFAQDLPAEQPDPLLRRLRRRDEHLPGLRRQPRRAASERRVPAGRHRRDGAHVRQLQPRAAGYDAVHGVARPADDRHGDLCGRHAATATASIRSVPTSRCRLVHAAVGRQSAAPISSAAACRPAARVRASWRTGRSPSAAFAPGGTQNGTPVGSTLGRALNAAIGEQDRRS